MRKCIIRSILIILSILLTITYAFAQEGKILRIKFHSPSLENNLFNDSPDRDVTIYLPPSYDVDTNMRYPVVYLLHGYTGNDMLWTGGSYIRNGNIRDWMDMWLEEGKVKEMILVMPNSYNIFRGSQYTNSVVTGNWADYIAKDLVSYMDEKYRTLAQRESRAIIGHSMGGRGALSIAMRYPKVFGCAGSMAGAFLIEDLFDSDSSSWAAMSTIESWQQFYSLRWEDQAKFSVTAAFAPNPQKQPFYCDFPYIYTDTKPKKVIKDQVAYDKFMVHEIFRMIENHLSELKGMLAIYIDCGINDPIVSVYDSRRIHEKLNELGVKHDYKEFIGDHTCCVMNSTGDALEVFSKAMAFEMLTGVGPEGKLATTWGEIRRTK